MSVSRMVAEVMEAARDAFARVRPEILASGEKVANGGQRLCSTLFGR